MVSVETVPQGLAQSENCKDFLYELKFMFSKKATKNCEIFTVDLTFT